MYLHCHELVVDHDLLREAAERCGQCGVTTDVKSQAYKSAPIVALY